MSLASTVSSVIDVPPTHSSGVARILTGLDRGDLVLARLEQRRAAVGDAGLVRLDDEPRPGREDHDEDRDDDARAGERERGVVGPSSARPMPSAAFVSASRTTMAGDPIVGMSTNGMTRLPRIAPVVFTPSSSPDSEPAVPRSSRSSSEAVGKARPSTIVTGRTVRTAAPEQDADGHQRLGRVERRAAARSRGSGRRR